MQLSARRAKALLEERGASTPPELLAWSLAAMRAATSQAPSISRRALHAYPKLPLFFNADDG
eukprot:5088966-Pyramimonas_sp.AAC.1